MKRKLMCFLQIFLMLLTLCSCDSSGKDNSLKKVLDKKSIVVGLDPSAGIMSSQDKNGDFVGFSVDCARACAKRLGISVSFVATLPDDMGTALDDGKIDCFWDFSKPSRQLKAKYLFSPSHAVHHQTVIVGSSSSVLSLADLTGKTVGVVKNSYAHEALKGAGVLYSKLGGVQEYSTLAQLFEAIDANNIHAAIADDNEAFNYTLKLEEKKYKILDSYISTDEYFAAFRRADLSLEGRMKDVLSDMANDGTLADISKKWFGRDITVK